MSNEDDPRGPRDDKGRFGPNNRYSLGQKPKVWLEYKYWLEEQCLPKAQAVMLKCLDSDNEKIQMIAVREVHDRVFGKSRQQVSVTGEEGRSLGTELLPLLQKLIEKK